MKTRIFIHPSSDSAYFEQTAVRFPGEAVRNQIKSGTPWVIVEVRQLSHAIGRRPCRGNVVTFPDPQPVEVAS